MDLLKIKVEIPEETWAEYRFGVDLETTIKNEELVRNLCSSEIDIKDEVRDVIKEEVDTEHEIDKYNNYHLVNTSENEHTDVTGRIGVTSNPELQLPAIQSSSTSSTGTLVLHNKLTYSGNNPYECNVCNYKTFMKDCIVRHMHNHSGLKAFACNVCNFKFRHKGDLVRHMRSHTGEKPFKCSICSFKSTRKGGLDTHFMRHHTGEKAFECNVCAFKSFQKEHLVKHMRKHTGEKPFGCNICIFRSDNLGSLFRHMRRH